MGGGGPEDVVRCGSELGRAGGERVGVTLLCRRLFTTPCISEPSSCGHRRRGLSSLQTRRSGDTSPMGFFPVVLIFTEEGAPWVDGAAMFNKVDISDVWQVLDSDENERTLSKAYFNITGSSAMETSFRFIPEVLRTRDPRRALCSLLYRGIQQFLSTLVWLPGEIPDYAKRATRLGGLLCDLGRAGRHRASPPQSRGRRLPRGNPASRRQPQPLGNRLARGSCRPLGTVATIVAVVVRSESRRKIALGQPSRHPAGEPAAAREPPPPSPPPHSQRSAFAARLAATSWLQGAGPGGVTGQPARPPVPPVPQAASMEAKHAPESATPQVVGAGQLGPQHVACGGLVGSGNSASGHRLRPKRGNLLGPKWKWIGRLRQNTPVRSLA